MDTREKILTAAAASDARKLALDAWSEGNAAGDGFDPGCLADADINSLDGLGALVLRSETDIDVAVYDDPQAHDGRGEMIVVGDAHGAWCVRA